MDIAGSIGSMAGGGQLDTIFGGILAMLVVGMIVFMIIIIRNITKYNKYTDVWTNVGGGAYKLIRTKGCITKDKNNVRTFESLKFGKDKKKIIYREPNNELFGDFERPLFNFPGLPLTQCDQIAFLNPFGETFIPIRRSFISIRRGVDINITSKEDCEFCQEAVDLTDYLDNPKKYLNKIKDNNRICENCFTKIVNARYECIDQSDLSWMWKQIDDVKSKFGDFMTKYGTVIVALGSMVFVLAVIIFTYKMQPDIQAQIASNWKSYMQVAQQGMYETAKNMTIPSK